MAFFKFRKGGDEAAVAPAQPDSIATLRKRALHRLIGAALLVAAAVIGFPMLFDSQPRPISVDIPIDIPDKNKTRPLAAPAAMPPAPVAAATPPAPEQAKEPVETIISGKSEEKVPVAPVDTAQPATKKVAIPESKPDKPEAKSPPKTESKAEPKAEPKAIAKAEPKPAAKPDDSAKAQALLDGKSPDAAAATPAAAGRFVVQVGAYADATRAREARSKLEQAGLKTYTQVVDTKDGSRTRVRVGPFSDKAEADKAASKIKALDLPASVLTL